MTKYAEWRAWIGPMILPASEATAYDWTWINEGATGQIGAVSSTLSATLSSGVTTISLASAASFPTKGSVFVAPNGSGQAWEVVRYSGKSGNNLTGCVREATADREHNGIHTSGAAVYFWYPVTVDDGRLRLTQEMDGNLSAVMWQAELSGVKFPQGMIRNRHLCVVEYRQSVTASWAILLVGFLDSPGVRDDYTKKAAWTARVQSLAQWMNRHEAAGIRVGELDIAKHIDGSGSDVVLADVDAERASGDFTAANPDLSASSTADEGDDTLWIGERVLGTPNTPAANDDPNHGVSQGLRITGLYVNPRPGERSGTRWIECTAHKSCVPTGLSLQSANGANPDAQWLFNFPPQMEAGEKLIICEDASVFAELHPLADAVMIREDTVNFFDHILPAGGHIGLRMGGASDWWCTVAWGTGNGYLGDGADWDGPTVAAPGEGQTLRYLWASRGGTPNPADFWSVGLIQTAGYNISSSPAAWIRLDLPPLGLVLRDDVTAVAPAAGAALYITDGAGPSTTGLPASGIIQIGSEQISYSAKFADHVVVSARGYSVTDAAAHNAGDTVEVIWNGEATQAHLVKEIGWRRFNGSAVPKWFRLKVTHLENARNPTDTAYNNDWVQLASVTNNVAALWDYGLVPARRVRSLLFQIETMSANPSRPRLNEIIALVDESTWPTDLVLPEGTSVAGIIGQIMENIGIPSGALLSDPTDSVNSLTTAKEFAWNVIADLAQYAGVRVDVNRDSKLYVRDDPYWSVPSWTASQTWTTLLAAAVEVSFTNNEPVSQVELSWKSPNSGAEGVVRYPDAPWSDGRVLKVGPQFFGSEASAATAAQRMFFLRRYPYTLVVECADAYPSVKAGDIHALQWQLHDEMQETNRLYIVQTAEHFIEAGRWTTVLNLIEIDRSQM